MYTFIKHFNLLKPINIQAVYLDRSKCGISGALVYKYEYNSISSTGMEIAFTVTEPQFWIIQGTKVNYCYLAIIYILYSSIVLRVIFAILLNNNCV